MFDDTSLLRMVIDDLAKRHNWSLEETFDRFYRSKTCKNLSDTRTGLFTFAPKEIIELFEEEIPPMQITVRKPTESEISAFRSLPTWGCGGVWFG